MTNEGSLKVLFEIEEAARRGISLAPERTLYLVAWLRQSQQDKETAEAITEAALQRVVDSSSRRRSA